MNALLLPLSILCGLILCATAISLFAVHRAHCLLTGMDGRAGEKQSRTDAELQALRDSVEALAAQLHDLRNHPPVAPPPGLPKPGLNLSKRSQALRMHRRGEVVVVEGNYGVRIQQIVSRTDRLRSVR